MGRHGIGFADQEFLRAVGLLDEQSHFPAVSVDFFEELDSLRGRGHVRGPISPSLNDTCGLLVDGFDTDSMLLMPHNPPEYAGFIEAAPRISDLVSSRACCLLPPQVVMRFWYRSQVKPA